MSIVTIKVKRQQSEENIVLKVMVRNSEKSWEFILFPLPLPFSFLTHTSIKVYKTRSASASRSDLSPRRTTATHPFT